MTSAEAKKTISDLAAASPRNLRFVSHAREQMSARNISFHDLRNALINSTACAPSTDGGGRWVVTGPDLNGESTRVVCVIENGVLIITVF